MSNTIIHTLTPFVCISNINWYCVIHMLETNDILCIV